MIKTNYIRLQQHNFLFQQKTCLFYILIVSLIFCCLHLKSFAMLCKGVFFFSLVRYPFFLLFLLQFLILAYLSHSFLPFIMKLFSALAVISNTVLLCWMHMCTAFDSCTPKCVCLVNLSICLLPCLDFIFTEFGTEKSSLTLNTYSALTLD